MDIVVVAKCIIILMVAVAVCYIGNLIWKTMSTDEQRHEGEDE